MEIESREFGKIIIDGQTYTHDVVIFPDTIKKRKKWITKQQHGTSHKFTREEMEEYLRQVDQDQLTTVVIGTGHYGKLGLLDETKELLKEKEIQFVERKTPEAIAYYVKSDHPRSKTLGIFHVTC